MSGEQHQIDLQEVCGWLNARSVTDIEVRYEQISIESLLKQISEMESTYDEFPNDRARTEKIYNLIKSGEDTCPLYVEDGDSTLFVMEGRHRMVAFHWLGKTEVSICFCKLKSA